MLLLSLGKPYFPYSLSNHHEHSEQPPACGCVFGRGSLSCLSAHYPCRSLSSKRTYGECYLCLSVTHNQYQYCPLIGNTGRCLVTLSVPSVPKLPVRVDCVLSDRSIAQLLVRYGINKRLVSFAFGFTVLCMCYKPRLLGGYAAQRNT